MSTLTPEEQAELEQLEQLAASPLSQEEQAELAELEALESQEAPSQLESAGKGFLQGASLGFADEALAALQTGGEAVAKAVVEKTIPDLSELSTAYTENRNALRDSFDAAEKANPNSFMAGDIAGGVTTAFIPGANAATLGKAASLGAVTGLGRSAEEDIQGMAVDSLLGTALGATGFGMGKVLQKGVDKASQKLAGFLENESVQGYMRALGYTGKSGRYKFNEMLENSNIDKKKFFERVLTEQADDGSLIFSATKQTDEILENIKVKTANLSEELEKSIQMADEVMGGPSIAPRDLKNFIQSSVVERLRNSKEPGLKKIAEQLDERLTVTFASQEPWSLYEAWQYKKDLFEQVKNFSPSDNPSIKDALRQFGSKTNNFIKGKVLSRPGLDPVFKQTYSETNERMHFLLNAEDAIKRNLATMDDSVMGTVRKALSYVTSIPGGVAAGAAYGGPSGAAAGLVLSMAAKSSNVDLVYGKAMEKAANAIQSSPKLASKIIAAASVSKEAFDNALSYAGSLYDFSQSPLPRNTAALLENAHKVQVILDEENPQLADQFREAVENKDEDLIAGIMSQLAVSSKGSKLIQQGIGWDGRAITQGDIATVQEQINGAAVSSTQKAELLNKFNKDRIIPEIQPEKPFYKVYDPALKTSVMR